MRTRIQLETILVVEDEPNDQLFIKEGLREAGFSGSIHVVNDGMEAVNYMMGEGLYADRDQFAYPTFIMTDIKMPRMDGFGVLEFLKKNPAWRIIPTVVLSASSDLDDIKKSYMLGASSYHVKPQDLDQLRRQLKVLYNYWITCETPQVDTTGKQLHTESEGKLGERFPQVSTSAREPHR
jgi:CheY-like chemotaxis protein